MRLDRRMYNRFAPSAWRERTRLYDRWTITGLECDEISGLCELCPTYKSYGISKETGCKQEESNQILKDKGIKKPIRPFKLGVYDEVSND